MNSENPAPTQQELQDLPSNNQIINQPMLEQNINIQRPKNPINPNKTNLKKFADYICFKNKLSITVLFILEMELFYFFVVIFTEGYYNNNLFKVISAVGNFSFALFVWAPMATKIEKCSSTVRYFLLFLINSVILYIITLFGFTYISKLWCFVLFETILISLSNKEKKIKFFCFKISGNKLVPLTIIYSFCFNSFISILAVIIYVFIYRKILIKKLVISNEKVLSLENFCLFNFLKNHTKSFISLEQSNLKSNTNNNNLSSFIPSNMYPNSYNYSSYCWNIQHQFNVENQAQAQNQVNHMYIEPGNNIMPDSS